MNGATGHGPLLPRDNRLQELALDLAITLRVCSSRLWCNAGERRAFRVAMRVEALKWRRAATPGR